LYLHVFNESGKSPQQRLCLRQALCIMPVFHCLMSLNGPALKNRVPKELAHAIREAVKTKSDSGSICWGGLEGCCQVQETVVHVERLGVCILGRCCCGLLFHRNMASRCSMSTSTGFTYLLHPQKVHKQKKTTFSSPTFIDRLHMFGIAEGLSKWKS